MQYDFELFLTLASLFTGLCLLAHTFYFSKITTSLHKKNNFLAKATENIGSFFWVMLTVWALRSFLIEPFRIPTGSLEPSLLPGDFIAANKYSYGLRLPVSHHKIMAYKNPVIGDIVVFRWPVDPSIDFIKRVIGTPGDTVSYKNKILYINGIEQPQVKIGPAIDQESEGDIPVIKYEEILNGVKHFIYINPLKYDDDFTVTVPPGHYFMMGDNRDDSGDSRYWGYVPDKNILGKAVIIWLSLDKNTDNWFEKIRWNRIFTKINA